MTSEPETRPSELHARVSDGSTAVVIGYANSVLTLVSDVAHPPGRPLKLDTHSDAAVLALEGRIIASKRGEDGRYTITLRLTSLRREVRSFLETRFPT